MTSKIRERDDAIGRVALVEENDLGRFASTVAFYERARQPYGAAFFATVVQTLGYDRSQRLLDLGTGPGLLAMGFAPFFGEVIGVDPERAMIAAACEAAERPGVALRLIEGRAETLPTSIGTFDVVTIGRALHWMDPEATRAVLDRVVAPHGSILICRAGSVADSRNPWLVAYNAARKRWTEKSGADRYGLDADAFFADTRFLRGETISVETEQTIPIERLIDRVLSMSSSSPKRVGDEVERMRAAMCEALSPFALDGLIREIVEARAEVFELASISRHGSSVYIGGRNVLISSAMPSMPPKRWLVG